MKNSICLISIFISSIYSQAYAAESPFKKVRRIICRDDNPLLQASKNGDVDAVKQLLTDGFSINIRDKHGCTPLYRAIAKYYINCAQVLLDHKADVNISNTRNFTPLMIAVKNSHLEAAKLLLDHNADVNARNFERATALHMALQDIASTKNQRAIVQLLLEYKADPNILYINKTPPLKLSVAGLKGAHEMLSSNTYCDPNIIKLLLAYGADINASDKHGVTALHAACRRGHFDAIKLLIAHKASVNVFDRQGDSPLMSCIWHGYIEPIKTLIACGADIMARDIRGFTPLHYAAQYGDSEVGQLLIALGANINAQNSGGETPLHVATKNLVCYCTEQECVKTVIIELLLNNAASLEASTLNGDTALHYAAREHNISGIITLISHGANLFAVNAIKNTPLELAQNSIYWNDAQPAMQKECTRHLRIAQNKLLLRACDAQKYMRTLEGSCLLTLMYCKDERIIHESTTALPTVLHEKLDELFNSLLLIEQIKRKYPDFVNPEMHQNCVTHQACQFASHIAPAQMLH